MTVRRFIGRHRQDVRRQRLGELAVAVGVQVHRIEREVRVGQVDDAAEIDVDDMRLRTRTRC